MNKRIRNVFFLIGLVAVVFLMINLDLSLASLQNLLKQAGVYFPLILILWVAIYAINTLSWKQLLKGLDSGHIPFKVLYKITVSGFALNYVTPGGLNGGEAYRILALKPYVGVARASSSTLLYSILHIASHLLFWFIGAFILLFYSLPWTYNLIIGLVLISSLVLLWLFSLVMKKGAMHLLSVLLVRIPRLGSRVERFELKYRDTLLRIDEEVREVYLHRPKAFRNTLALEFAARLVGCLEISLLMIPLLGLQSFLVAYLVMAIASLMANLLFFMPMQLGGREGGFTLAFSLLGYSAQYGLFVGLLVRLRELVWILVGVLLIHKEKE